MYESEQNHQARSGAAWVWAVLTAALALTLNACASSGDPEAERAETVRRTLSIGNTIVEMNTEAGLRSRILAAPPDSIFGVMEGVYLQLGIPVEVLDPGGYQIGNQGYRPRRIDDQRLNTFIDCGTSYQGPLADLHEVELTVMSRLVSEEEGTRVQTTLDAFAKPRATSGNQVHCQSREVLEQRIVDLIAGRLGIPRND